MDFYVIINTYNRPKMANLLYESLRREFNKAGIGNYLIHFFNDGGEEIKFSSNKNIMTTYCNHHGKANYYKLVKHNFATRIKSNYYLKLDDDVVLCDGFIRKCLASWDSIKDSKKIVLNILRDDRKEMWGSGPPKKHNEFVQESNWVDLNFMCSENFMLAMDKLDLKPPPIWVDSSGVARQITRHIRGVCLKDTGLGSLVEVSFREPYGKMYQVNETLIYHGKHESKMNPERVGSLSNC